MNLALRQAVLALCAALAGLILLLLLGTEILDWPWIAGLFAAGLVAGLWDLRRRIPSPYRIAQSIDRRLGLSDALSTAFYYSHLASNRRVSDDIRAAQLAEANRLASEVPLEKAAPIEAPRSLYVMAVLVLAASGLLTLRYGIFHSLDLRPPLASFTLDSFHFIAQAAKPDPEEPKTKDKRLNQLLKEYGLSLEQNAENMAQAESKETAGSESAEGTGEAERRQAASEQPGPGEDAGEASDETAQSAREGQGDPLIANSPDAQNSSQQSASNESASSSMENNSLLEKFREAMQSLLSRLKTPPKPGGEQQMASAQSRSETGESRQGQGKKGSPSAGKQMEGRANGEQQGEQQGEGNQTAQAGPGQQGNAESQQASQQGNTGIGKEDGSKEIKEAEQLAAMGKISEIIGRRSQSLTGEAMAEVASGKQQLRTAYSQQNARHTEAGGAISRDEIPLAYQRYVQQYFEEIRKSPPPQRGSPTQ